MGRAARVGHIRRGSQVTVLVRRDWKWISVTGPADLIGPDDLRDGVDHEAVRLLLRDVFRARAEPTTTGTSTTVPWPTMLASPCSSLPSASSE